MPNGLEDITVPSGFEAESLRRRAAAQTKGWQEAHEIAIGLGFDTMMDLVNYMMRNPDWSPPDITGLTDEQFNDFIEMREEIQTWNPIAAHLGGWTILLASGGWSDLFIKSVLGRGDEIDASDLFTAVIETVGAIGLGNALSALKGLPKIGPKLAPFIDDILATPAKFSDLFKGLTRFTGKSAEKLTSYADVDKILTQIASTSANLGISWDEAARLLADDDMLSAMAKFAKEAGEEVIAKKLDAARRFGAEFFEEGVETAGKEVIEEATEAGAKGAILGRLGTGIKTGLAVAGLGGTVFGALGMMAWAAKEIFVEPYQFRMSDLIKDDPEMAEANLIQYVEYAIPGYQKFSAPVKAIPKYGDLYKGGAYMDQFWGWVSQLADKQGLSPEFIQFLNAIDNEQLLASPLAGKVMNKLGEGQSPIEILRDFYSQKLTEQDWTAWSEDEKQGFYSYLYASGNAFDEKNTIAAPGVDLAYSQYNEWIKDLGKEGLSSNDVFYIMDPIRRKAQELASGEMYFATEGDISDLLAYQEYLTTALKEYGSALTPSQKEQINVLLQTVENSLGEWSTEKQTDLSTIGFESITVTPLASLKTQKTSQIKSVNELMQGKTTPERIWTDLGLDEKAIDLRREMGERRLTPEISPEEKKTIFAEAERRGAGFAGPGATEAEKAAMAKVPSEPGPPIEGLTTSESRWVNGILTGTTDWETLRELNPDVFNSLISKGVTPDLVQPPAALPVEPTAAAVTPEAVDTMMTPDAFAELMGLFGITPPEVEETPAARIARGAAEATATQQAQIEAARARREKYPPRGGFTGAETPGPGMREEEYRTFLDNLADEEALEELGISIIQPTQPGYAPVYARRGQARTGGVPGQ